MSTNREIEQAENIFKFYRIYGLPGEGPSNANEVLSMILSSPHLQSEDSKIHNEMDIIKRLLTNTSLHNAFNECNTLIDRIALSANTKQLHDELESHILHMDLDFWQLFYGIASFDRALRTDPNRQSKKELESLFDQYPEIHKYFTFYYTTVGSLMLQLYISLVYMRGDHIRDTLQKYTQIETVPAIDNFSRLLNHDLVRHLRNALAHGHIKPTGVGLWFKDRSFEAITTPEFLRKLSINLYGFYHLAFSKLSRQRAT